MIVKTRNLLAVSSPKSYLSNNESAGTNIFRIRNTAGFGSSWAIQIGETGAEQTEVLLLSGSPGGTIGTSTANSTYEHSADTPIYAIKYDQIVFEVSLTGTAGTAAPLTNGTITYQADSEFTQFDDTAGSTTYAYRTFFRNSALAVNSTESDWITPAGFSFYSLANMRQRAKDKLWDAGYIKDDLTIDNWLNEIKDEFVTTLTTLNESYAIGTSQTAFDGTSGYGTITTADFTQAKQFWVTYDGVDDFESTRIDLSEIKPNAVYNSTLPRHAWRGDTVFQVLPVESGGTAKITFYRFGSILVEDTDELPLPLRPYTKAFVNYALAQALFKDGKTNEYALKIQEVERDKQMFISQLGDRDRSGPNTIRFVEAVSSDDLIP